MRGPGRITTVISDFGGVLTTPLIQSFAAVQDETGVQFEELGNAMTRIQEEDGRHPLFELETGRLSEADFLRKLGDALEPALGHRPELHRFREIYFEALHANEPMLALMRECRDRGLRMAILTKPRVSLFPSRQGRQLITGMTFGNTVTYGEQVM